MLGSCVIISWAPASNPLLRRGRPRSSIPANEHCASVLVPPWHFPSGVPQRREAHIGAGGFHSATFAIFARSLRFRSTQSPPRSIRRCVEPPAVPPVFPTAGVPQRRKARIGAGGFHSATFATFARSLRFRSTQSMPHSIRRFVEPPAPPYVYITGTPTSAESPQEGSAPVRASRCRGTPAVRRTGGKVRPVRSRAGSPHGEPRTEPPLRGDAAGPSRPVPGVSGLSSVRRRASSRRGLSRPRAPPCGRAGRTARPKALR